MTELDNKIKNAFDNNIWIVYRQPENKKCPNCEILERMFKMNNIEYKSIDISTPESLTELAFRASCFPKFTPVLQKGKHVYYRELWKEHGKVLDLERIKILIDGNRRWDSNEVDSNEVVCEGDVCEI